MMSHVGPGAVGRLETLRPRRVPAVSIEAEMIARY